MTRKRKHSSQQKTRARLEREVSAERGSRLVADLAVRSLAAAGFDPGQQDGPPPEAVEAYVEAFGWAQEHPAKAETLIGFDEKIWASLISGIAFPEIFDLPFDEVRTVAWQLRAWHILHGYKYAFDWKIPIAQLGEDQIIVQLRQDAKDGKIPEPGSANG